MTDYAIVFDTTTGAQIGNYMGPDGTAQAQSLPDGAAIMLVPAAAWAMPADLVMIKANQAAKIEAEAEATRLQFLTPGAGKALAYVEKALEVDAYALNAAHPVPFIAAEATARGITVAAMVAEVNLARAQFRLIGPRIESAVTEVKAALMAATNLGEIHSAAQVDWAAVVTGDN